MEPIAKKTLGKNDDTGLEEQVAVWSINIDAMEEKIIVGYCIETLSPTGKVVNQGPKQFYTRANTPEQRSGNGGEESELIAEADMRFDELRNSPTGQQIAAMIANDLKTYPEF